MKRFSFMFDFILGICSILFGLREFDYNNHYLTGLILVGCGFYLFYEASKNCPNNESLR